MNGDYDHIIIGAGSAGAVLAARLSEDAGRRVLLIEAGPGGRSPAGASFLDALEEPGRTWPDLIARRTAEQPETVYRRGRGLGGSSAVNAMIAIPGLPDDYDRWERLGADGWGWRELEPWFARTALELSMASQLERGPVEEALMAALPHQCGPVPMTRDASGRRRSTYECYLEPAMGRTNLRVLTDAAVDRVLLKERRAVGVRLLDGREFTGHEVIVSAGAIHSPALLLHSGVDTPGVGTGLKDHPSFPVMIRLSDDVAWDPHSLPVGIVGRASSGEEAADLQLLPMNHLGPSVPRAGLVMVALMEVRSQGRVSLVAGRSDAGLRPAIDFAMLADTTDMRRLGAGVEHLHRVFGTPSMRALGEPLFPPSDAVGLRTNLGDYVHAACTCAIGRVVDPSCRVIGYEGLRVGDASVMPDLPRANTHLTTVVIAERLAALIATGG